MSSIATVFTDLMTNITNNQQGALQVLNPVNLEGGRLRRIAATWTLNSDPEAEIVGICRLPLGSTLFAIDVLPSVSLGSTTIEFGDANSAAIYGAAATVTSTSAVTSFVKPGTYGVPITVGYDCLTGLSTVYTNDSGAGGGYEDIIMTTGAAEAPASGTVRIVVSYMID